MTVTLFEWFIITPSIMLWALLLHELGHKIAFKLLGKDVDIRLINKGWNFKFKLGYPLDYASLNHAQLYLVYGFGVLFGLMPLYYGFARLYWLNSLIILAAYFLGCRKDLKNMLDLVLMKAWKIDNKAKESRTEKTKAIEEALDNVFKDEEAKK